MARNTANDTISQRLTNTVKQLQKQGKDNRMNQTTYQGYLTLPVRSSDPPVTKTGQFGLYYNSGSGKVRKSYNGGSWADTTI